MMRGDINTPVADDPASWSECSPPAFRSLRRFNAVFAEVHNTNRYSARAAEPLEISGTKNKRAPIGRAVTSLHDSLSQLQANLLTECLVTNP
jgi:hypothetical protein